eukprot:scaffold148972_cov28-Tisochrysis_lutea.AAC.3
MLRSSASQPARWVVSRRTARPVNKRRHSAAGPVELCVEQPLDEFVTRGNTCSCDALDEDHEVSLSIHSGNEMAGPWSLPTTPVGGANAVAHTRASRGSWRARSQGARSGGLAICNWRAPRVGHLGHRQLLGDARGAAARGRWHSARGAGHGPLISAARLTAWSESCLSSQVMRTWERFASLVFVVRDVEGNAVPVEPLSKRRLNAQAPIPVTHAHSFQRDVRGAPACAGRCRTCA